MRDIDYRVHRLVARHKGALPVILTCPHGGNEQPPGVNKERTGSGLPAECRFKIKTDRFTRTITRGVAQTLFDIFAEEPYVVFANFDRKYIDANRTAQCAFEDTDAQPFYDEYHNTIREFVDEIRIDNGGLGLIFDIHGTEKVTNDPADVYLGTLNGDAISKLLSLDPRAMSRKRSLPGLLRREGYVVSSKTPETLQGDFTLETYGSSNADGIDAIQIEIESALRNDEGKRDEFIEDLGFAMISLVSRYTDTHTMSAYRGSNFLARLRRG
jgi:N-formylglutamate amidohydrolase